jgi:hypothetical protein
MQKDIILQWIITQWLPIQKDTILKYQVAKPLTLRDIIPRHQELALMLRVLTMEV